MPDAASALDRRFTAAAIRLGAGALGTTWPNPAVGAIVVQDGKVVGRGQTAPGGRPHAETLALAAAGEAARGSTLYVSLEPCSHHGCTPPCADAVIAAGIARVVAPLADPDVRVTGRGFARLEEAGIPVAKGVLADAAERAQAGHFSRVRSGRPFVTLKLAISADDAIGRTGEAQVAITGPTTRRHVQALRSRFDAILVGGGTVAADDPQLTCRLPGLEGRSPIRVILDTRGGLETDRRVFDNDGVPVWVFSASETEGGGQARRFRVPDASGRLDHDAVMQRLAEEGITRLLVEGGALTARRLLEADLVDEVLLFRSSAAVGGAAVPALAGLPLGFIEAAGRFHVRERRRFGEDVMSRYERVR